MTSMEPAEPTLSELMTRQMVLASIAKVFETEADELKAKINKKVLAAYDDSGVSQYHVKFMGEKAGTYIVPKTDDKVSVSDRKAFIAWCEEHFDHEVDLVPTVKPAFEAFLLKAAVPNFASETVTYQVIDKSTGELVDDIVIAGVTAVKGGKARTPYPMAKSEDRIAIFETIRTNSVLQLFEGKMTPQIEAPQLAVIVGEVVEEKPAPRKRAPRKATVKENSVD